MKFKVISTLSVAALAIAISACGNAANTTTNTTNANKPANTANTTTNTTSNTTNTSAANTTTNSAAANTGDMLNIDAAGIAVAAPKGFKIAKDGETTNLISPDEALEVYFHVPQDGDYDKAIDEVATEIDDYIKDVKVTGNAEKGEFGGMPATMFSGTGVDKESGEPVDWELIVLNAPKKPVLIVAYADKGAYEKYSKEVDEIAKSIKKQ